MQTRRRYIFLAATLLTFTAIGPSFAAGGRNGRLMRFPLPPMGWGSWNSFSNTIDSKIVVSQAHAIISTGMLAAGYKYMLMDEGWWIGKRDSKGNIIVDPRQWPALRPGEKPGDMRNIVRFLHRLGLKAGIYTDAGPFGCSFPYPDIGPHRPGTGSLGHYDQDMLRFAQQGFDYIKVDWCGGNARNLDPATQYTQIGRALERARAVTGHSLFFSICEWGNQSPWTWAPGIADMHGVMWRTGGDISWPIVDVPSEAGRRVSLQNVLNNFSAGIHPEAQHTGYYNDLDMMIVGMRGMSLSDDRVHMSLWAISGAPLIVGADLTKLTKAQAAVLTNRDAVAIDQDPMGVQCIQVGRGAPGLQVWAKPMAGAGVRAVVLLNRTPHAAPIIVRWSGIGLRSQTRAFVKNVWSPRNSGMHTAAFTATVPAHDADLLIVSGKAAAPLTYRSRVAPPVNDLRQSLAARCSGIYDAADHAVFRGISASRPSTYIEIQYKNTGPHAIVARLAVNGQYVTRVQFPSTTAAPGGIGMVPLEVRFGNPGGTNELRFASPCMNALLNIRSVTVLPW